MSNPSVTIATIPGGGAISPGVTLPAPGLFAIEIDGPWTPAALTLLATQDGQTYYNVLDGIGNEFVLPAISGARFQLNTEDWQAVTGLKVRSGTAAAPVNQALDTGIALIGYPAISPTPVPPNFLRMFTPLYNGDIGTFNEYTTSEEGILTFNVINLLGTDDSVETIESFTLAASADTTPAARVLASPGIQGTYLSVLLGNWQDVRYINYLVTVVFTTASGQTLSAQGYVAVERLGPCC